MQEQPLSNRHQFGLEQGVFIFLLIVSLLGMVITDFSPHDGYGYWLFMVLVFSLSSVFVSWLQSKAGEIEFGDIVKQQVLHWAHFLLIVIAAFLVQKSGQLSETAASLVILLLLALATMLDGIRIGWQFSLLGFYLAACAVIIAYVENFIWACGSLGLLVVIATFVWKIWFHRDRQDDEN